MFKRKIQKIIDEYITDNEPRICFTKDKGAVISFRGYDAWGQRFYLVDVLTMLLNELGYTIEITPATKALVKLKKDLTVVQSDPEV